MISFLDALALDIAGKVEHAANAYEQVLQLKDAPIEAFINLACLYWQSTDFGFNAHYRLSLEFIQKAGRRETEVLDEAERRFGTLPEITFWRMYFAFTSLGEDAFPSEALELVELPNCTNVPYFHIYDQTKDAKYVPKVMDLYNEAQSTQTTKNRYIISLLDSAFRS